MMAAPTSGPPRSQTEANAQATAAPPARNAMRDKRRATANRDPSLGALHPHLLDEWHPTKNPGLDPYTLKPGSEKRVWWRCAYCGDEWQAPPLSRRRSPRGGCPTCAARIAKVVKRVRAEAHDQ
jgi:hypothetical protein